MTKYIVTDKGPIDRRQPGDDVTGVYPADVLTRLIEDGYIAEDKPRKRTPAKPADALAGESDAVESDGQPADEDGE